MTKAQGRKVQKAVKKISKKVSKKVSKKAAKVKSKSKAKANRMLGSAKTKLSAMKKSSSKAYNSAKKKVYATEEEIVAYVKENPIKSVSAVALVALIGGFLSRLNK